MSNDNSSEMENLKIEIQRLRSQNLELIQAKADAEEAKVKVESRTPSFFERVFSSSRSAFTQVKRTSSESDLDKIKIQHLSTPANKTKSRAPPTEEEYDLEVYLNQVIQRSCDEEPPKKLAEKVLQRIKDIQSH
jgi:molybdopterin-biosynthesis enzyme MoeA-like protein